MNLVNRFVTAKLKGEDACRQGVCLVQGPEAIIILGESGTQYECEPDARIVPLENLYGSTREFAIKQGVTG